MRRSVIPAPLRFPSPELSPLRAEPPLRRRLAAIAFLDVVGYSHAVGADEDSALRAWATVQRAVIEPAARIWRGRVVSRAGDGLFLEFNSALDAFRWATDVQAEMEGGAQAAVKLRLRVRIALHLGDVIDDADGQVLGDGVNTAARLQAFAKPGGIVLSQGFAAEVAGKTDVAFADLGLLNLKNIARPVRAFHVAPANGPPQSPNVATQRRTLVWWASRGGFCVGVAAVVAAALTMTPPARRFAPETRAEAFHAPTPREQAIRLTQQGQAVTCAEHPCPRAWLASRALYERAIAADATYGPAYAYAALTHTDFVLNGLSSDDDADLRASERLVDQAVSLAPESAVAHRARGAVLSMQPDRLESALLAYQRSLAIDPDQPVARANVGWLLLALGHPAEAEQSLRRAIADAPDHLFMAGWLTFLGTARLFQDQADHGALEFRRALALQSPEAAKSPVGVERAVDLAAALALNGDVDEANQIATALRRQDPALSTHSLWGCDCSHAPAYLAGLLKIKQGMLLAGIPDGP